MTFVCGVIFLVSRRAWSLAWLFGNVSTISLRRQEVETTQALPMPGAGMGLLLFS